MRIILPACCLLLLALFWGCQKEVSFDDPLVNTPQTPTTNDSTLLAKLIYMDTTLAHPDDTVAAMDIFYNTQKRVERYSQYYYAGGTLYLSELGHFFYAGNDTMPFKEIITHPASTPGLRDTTIIFYTHDNLARIVRDSIIFYTAGFPLATTMLVFDYVYTSTGRIDSRQRSYTLSGLQGSSKKIHMFQFTGVNISAETDSIAETGFATYSSHQIGATYDSRPNPLKKAFGIGYKHLFEDDGINSTQVNNFLTFNYAEYNPLGVITNQDRLIFNYDYNIAGYPVAARVTDLTGNYDFGNKIIYKYTK